LEKHNKQRKQTNQSLKSLQIPTQFPSTQTDGAKQVTAAQRLIGSGFTGYKGTQAPFTQ
jgi:hypothetical protein